MEPLAEDRRDRIDELEDQAEVDRALIEHLKADKIADAKQIENLKIALETARVIGTAIGILMSTRKVTDQAAFDLLANASQSRNIRVRQIADRVVLTGEVP